MRWGGSSMDESPVQFWSYGEMLNLKFAASSLQRQEFYQWGNECPGVEVLVSFVPVCHGIVSPIIYRSTNVCDDKTTAQDKYALKRTMCKMELAIPRKTSDLYIESGPRIQGHLIHTILIYNYIPLYVSSEYHATHPRIWLKAHPFSVHFDRIRILGLLIFVFTRTQLILLLITAYV